MTHLEGFWQPETDSSRGSWRNARTHALPFSGCKYHTPWILVQWGIVLWYVDTLNCTVSREVRVSPSYRHKMPFYAAMGAVQLGLHVDTWTEGSLKSVPVFHQLHLSALSTHPISADLETSSWSFQFYWELHAVWLCCFHLAFTSADFSLWAAGALPGPRRCCRLPTPEPSALETSCSPTPALSPVMHACSSEAPPPCLYQEHALWTVELFVLRIFLVLETNALYPLDFFFFWWFLLMWTIFKVFIEFVTILLLFYFFFFFFWLRGMWDLIFQPGTEPAIPSLERKVLTTGLPAKSLLWHLLRLKYIHLLSVYKLLLCLSPLRFNRWVGKIPWRRHGNPLQYSCLENPMDGGAW